MVQAVVWPIGTTTPKEETQNERRNKPERRCQPRDRDLSPKENYANEEIDGKKQETVLDCEAKNKGNIEG